MDWSQRLELVLHEVTTHRRGRSGCLCLVQGAGSQVWNSRTWLHGQWKEATKEGGCRGTEEEAEVRKEEG